MGRRKDRVLLILSLLVIGGVVVALEYQVRPVILLFTAGIGVGFIAGGIHMIVTRRARIPVGESDDPPAEQHTGLSAQLWGVLVAMFGGLCLLFTYDMWRRPHDSSEAMAERLANPFYRGLAVTALGAMVGIYGLTRLVANKDAFSEIGLSPTHRWLSGVASVLIGAVFVALGLMMMLSPDSLTALQGGLAGFIKSRL